MKGFIKKTEFRLILNENDSYHGESLCRLVVEEAHRIGISGATVIQAKGGFGNHHKIHTSEVLRLSNDLPVIILIVDDLEKLMPLVDFIKERFKGGLLSLQEIWVNGQ